MAYIKNIAHEEVLALADQVQVAPGQVVSRTLAQNDAVSITVFAFAAGEEDRYTRFCRRRSGHGSRRNGPLHR